MQVLTHLFGGWNRLQRLYPDRPMEVERTYSGSSLYFGHSLFGSYRRCIDVSIGALGLRVRVRCLSSKYFLPPFVITWPDITRCEATRMGFVGEAVKLCVGGWSHPLYLGRFLWKYGDVCREIQRRWELARKGVAQ
jgi:hypothetical protein